VIRHEVLGDLDQQHASPAGPPSVKYPIPASVPTTGLQYTMRT